MRHRLLVDNFALIVLIVIGIIVYGSLYPFAFQAEPPGALHALLEHWNRAPEPADGLANILLYMPLGYFGLLAIRRELPARQRLAAVMLLGLSLSVCMELLQYYDAGRDTEASDVYTNVGGTALGLVLAQALGDLRHLLPRRRLGDPAALLLLAAWTGYKLFPFVPVIDLHKYWEALKPLLHPDLSLYSLFTHAASWFAAGVLMAAALDDQPVALPFAAFVVLLLGGKILVTGGALSAGDIAGAAIAFLLFIVLAARLRPALAAILLGGAVIASRLEPFHFTAIAGSFGWIPFLSMMGGSVTVDAASFLEKAFLYGSLIWLLGRLGWPPRAASLSVALALLATSIAEIYLPGRSAEITDAAMALLAGALIVLVRTPERRRT